MGKHSDPPMNPAPCPKLMRIRTKLWMKITLILALTTRLVSSLHAANEVSMTLNGKPAPVGDYTPDKIQSLVLDNGLLKITFGHDYRNEISALSIIKNGTELAHNLHGTVPRDTDGRRTFYHDYNASTGYMHTRDVKILENTPELVHFALIDTGTPYLEDHYVMLKGESGIHPYVIIKGGFNGEMRTMYRFDMSILDWTWTNERVSQQKSYAYLQGISQIGNMGDETWRMPDGVVYSKYDYCVYYSESPMWGHFGHGFGAFFIPVSTEAYAGGPLRDELAVHQDALILNYLGGGHFSGGGTAGARNGEKIFGPWYVYINAGPTPDAIMADAKLTALAEEQKWPYPWVKETVYPIKRTAVSGQLRVSHGRSAAYAYIILGQPDNMQGGRGGGRGGRTPPGVNNGQATDRASILYNQAGDYIFYVKADVDGKFTLPHVRPGTYTLYAWQTQGPITQSYAKDNIVVSGDKLDLGVLDWDPPYHPNLIWQIGKADRMAGEFKYGNVPRYDEWIKQVPATMTFTIGQSNDQTDWYFAQPTGTWTVKFNVDKVPSGNGYLTIAIAGGGGSVTAALNGTTVGQLAYGDDGSVRRSTNRSGRYARNEYTFPGSDLKQGENTLTLQTVSGGLMYDTIVMESD